VKNVRTAKLIILLLGDVQKKRSDCFPLFVREKDELADAVIVEVR